MKFNLSLSSLIQPLIKRFLVIGIPALLLVGFFLQSIYRNQYEVVVNEIEKKQELLTAINSYQIQNLFKEVYNDLKLIRYSNEFDDYVDNPESSEMYGELVNMFSRFLNSKIKYSQIRYLTNEGLEVARVHKKLGVIEIVESADLQDKSERYYFRSLDALHTETMYVSDFDLNVENGDVVYPYEPTIRFALPIIDQGVREGFLIMNFDGFSLLEILESYESNRVSSIDIGLIDRNHFISMKEFKTGRDLNGIFELNISSELYNDLVTEKTNRINKNGHIYFSEIIESDDIPIVFDSISGTWFILSSFNLNLIIENESNFYLKHPWIQPLLLAVMAGFILIILFLFSLKESEHLLLMASGYISDNSREGIIILDKNKSLIYCNSVFETLYGYTFQEIRGKQPHKFLRSGSINFLRSGSINTLNLDLTEEIAWEGNIWDLAANNVYIQKYLKIYTVQTRPGTVSYWIGIYSEPKSLLGEVIIENNMQPYYLMTEDTVDMLTSNLAALGAGKQAVIVLKLQGVSSLRYRLTDREERDFITNLTSHLYDLVIDEGVILVPTSELLLISVPIERESDIVDLMENLDKAISSIRFFQQMDSPLRYISGIAVSPDHGESKRELVNNAFIALEALSSMKKAKYLIYNHDIYEEVKQTRIIKDEIENAFLRDEFHVVYQLQMDVTSMNITGAEALVRWDSARLGALSPNLFIPIMEETKQIKRLGICILGKVLKEITSLMPLLPEDARISINLSSEEFNDYSLIMNLIELIGKSPIRTENICFEITETSLIEDLDHTNRIIQLLHQNDISVAIDDFGTGYSSLSYLKKLQSDKLKVDRMFIKDYPTDDGTILKAISSLAQEMRIKVIVEGVETYDQLGFIKSLGCEEFQGYLSSRPIGLEELKKRLIMQEKV